MIDLDRLQTRIELVDNLIQYQQAIDESLKYINLYLRELYDAVSIEEALRERDALEA